MKKLVFAFMALLSFGALSAQEQPSEMLSELRKYRLKVNYEYEITGLQDVKVVGTAIIQNNCFRLEGAGLLILCDSESIWTIDLAGKEAYVEEAGQMDYLDYLTDLNWENDRLVGSVAVPNGTILNFSLFDIEKSPVSGDLSLFVPSEDFFNDGGDWIITDLR
ncbi:MAG: outer membrane lipoprotein carrier protein LolA [Candidatus Cryptobacteroides sp.]